jgi:hypothetical protein
VFRHLPEGRGFSPINLFHLLRCSDTYPKAGGSLVTAFGISRCSSPNKSVSYDIAEKLLKINVRENRRGNTNWTIQRKQKRQYKLDKPENQATSGTEKQNKNTTQYVLDTTICKQTQATQRRHEPSYKQLEVKTNRTSLVCGNHNGIHNTVKVTIQNAK